MTDTLPDVEVTGQRRKSPSMPFPARGGGGNLGDTPGRTIDLAEDDPEPPPAGDPCADPAAALEWNADAAAAEAAKEFARRAAARTPPETLNDREWGAYLYRAADGSIQIGPIAFGPRFSSGGVGTVNPSTAGLDPRQL